MPTATATKKQPSPKSPAPKRAGPNFGHSASTKPLGPLAPSEEEIEALRYGEVPLIDTIVPVSGEYFGENQVDPNQVSPVRRRGPAKRALYTPDGHVRLVPAQDVRPCLKEGFKVRCPLCHGDHLKKLDDGRTVYDTTPNACPARAARPFTVCPYCWQKNGITKRLYIETATEFSITDIDPLAQVLPMQSEAGNVSKGLEAVYLMHLRGKHPQEAIALGLTLERVVIPDRPVMPGQTQPAVTPVAG